MNLIARFSLPLLALALAGCVGTGPMQMAQAPVIAAPVMAPVRPVVVSPAATTQVALQTTNVSNFIDAGAQSYLTPKDSTEASSAQFYALQFGRPGAPREWSGDKGTTGSISVGPYVRVNNLDCRDFTNTVTIGGTPYTKKGTACREQNGTWAVASANA